MLGGGVLMIDREVHVGAGIERTKWKKSLPPQHAN